MLHNYTIMTVQYNYNNIKVMQYPCVSLLTFQVVSEKENTHNYVWETRQ